MGSFTSTVQEKLAKNGHTVSQYCEQSGSCHCLIITNIAKNEPNRLFRLYFSHFGKYGKQHAIAHIWEGNHCRRKNVKSLGIGPNEKSFCVTLDDEQFDWDDQYHWFADWDKNGWDITKKLENNGLSIDTVVEWVGNHIESECKSVG